MSYVERGDPGSGDGFEDGDYSRVRIDRHQARGWRRWGIEPLEAARWISHGVAEPIDAVRWSPAVQPEQVAELEAAGLDSGLLARWREHGASVKEAIAGVAKGQKPEDRAMQRSNKGLRVALRGMAGNRGLRAATIVARQPEPTDDEDTELEKAIEDAIDGLGSMRHAYLQVGWIDGDAVPWASMGIDPLDARDWMKLGLVPVEAAQQERLGLGPTEVALLWWKAGFAPDEVAAWIGAGMSPEEAAGQKAKGVTLEQAAVMRSLRQGEQEA